jgi:hypothetical protein
MATSGSEYLARLRALLGDRAGALVYPCIEDLVENGLSLDRFAPGEYPPCRQDVTQFLAAWFRHAGLDDEACRGWLIEFCAEVLVVLSRRTPAAIRHSTRSNIKYIYGYGVDFACRCEQNRFRARCRVECPAYAEMQSRKAAEDAGTYDPRPRRPLGYVPIPALVPVKARHREQFERAMAMVREEMTRGKRLERVLKMLKEQGYKTRTGREWSLSVLSREWSKAKAAEVPPEVPPQGAADASPAGV